MAFAASVNDSLLIGATGAANSKSQLDVRSTTRGVLLPRMTTTQQNAISSPPEGLFLYDTTNHQLSIYDGTAWQAMFDAGNLTGTLPGGALPAPTAIVLGGVFSSTAPANNYATGVDLTGAVTYARPTCANLSNSTSSCSTANATANTPSTLVARDGSGNFTAGTITATSFVGALTGNASTATTATNVTTNANLTGPITSVGNATSVAAQTGTGSVFVMQASPTLTTPNLGTPSTLIGTNITGTATSFTASNVTTNANLTGDVTSVGNATTIGAGKVTNAMLAGSIAASKLVGTDIATVGTITAGTWTGTTIAIANGGTGLATLTAHSLQVGNGTSAVTQITVPATGTVLTGIASSDPAFSAAPVLGVAGTTAGTLGLSGVTSGVTTLKAADSTTSHTVKLPATVCALGQVWTDDSTGVMSCASAPTPNGVYAYNFLINSGFDYWQRGTSATVTATGGSVPTNAYLYQADQWYVRNVLGGGTIEGIITYSQQAAVTNGSGFGAQVKITTAPTGVGIGNGAELWQTLSNKASLPLYGQTASFTVLVKCLNNVNQMGAQFFYATTELKANVGNTIGAEQTVSCNTSTFVSLTITGQALGTSQTAAGTIGIRIRPTGVASGNLYDLNNGYVVEQAMLNIGATAASWARQSNDPSREFAAGQYFFNKSYMLGTAPGTNTGTDSLGAVMLRTFTPNVTGPFRWQIALPVQMRAQPNMTGYSTDGTSAKIRDRTNATNVNASFSNTGDKYFTIETNASSATTAPFFEGHWTADASL